jgi:D-alanyl-D-alanine carboxypeptidase
VTRRFWVVFALTVAVAWPATAIDTRPLERLTARAAILVDSATGEVRFARNPDQPLPPASTTKILTALIAVHSGKLDWHAPVSRYASEMQPSKIHLRPGWRMTIEDLVYAILLNSANDASVVLAEGLSGSVEQFARQMNRTARVLGATQSNFVNPNGLPAPGHYASARDLALIMRHALREPRLRQILSTQTHVIRPVAGSTRRIALRSHNRMLGKADVHVIGKTGWTREAKRCFVGAASAGGREVVFAVLGATNLWGDIERLVDVGLGRGVHAPAPVGWQEAATEVRRSAPAGDADERGWTARYDVQLASFRNRTAAERLRQRVARRGYRPVVETVKARRRVWYRVTLRGFANRALAQKAARDVGRTYGLKPIVTATPA